MKHLRLALPCLFSLLPLLCVAQSDAAFGKYESFSEKRGELRAVWKSPLQGYVVDLRERNTRVFHLTNTTCWLDKEIVELAAEQMKFVRIRADQQAVKVSAAQDASETLLVRLDGLPASCDRAPDRSPLAAFDALDQTMLELFAFFTERKVDWQKDVRAARTALGRDPSESAVYEAMTKLLTSLDDPHITLQAKVEGNDRRAIIGRGATLTQLRKAFESQSNIKSSAEFYRNWIQATQRAVSESALNGKGRLALNNTAYWGISQNANGDIGYVSMTGMSGFTRSGETEEDIEAVNSFFDEVITACKSCKAIILDLSQNRGGDDRVALAVATRFTDEPRVAFSKQAVSRNMKGDVQTFRLAPGAKARWTHPVVLVTDSVTVSAAEVLTLSMRVLPHVRHVGATTRGALSDALGKSLPNGWRFTLSNEIYRSADGEIYEARGIPPTEPRVVFDPENLFAGNAKLIGEIVNAIRK